jgi:methylglyoxal synthase
MERSIIKLGQKKHIAMVAHDNKKQDLLEWARWNRSLLIEHELYATGTTGKLLEKVLGVTVHKFRSGPLGGDQQIGAKISEGVIDFMIFFWDPLTEQPHDADVKALLRIAVVWNIPTACNRASADFMISSTLMTDEYERLVTDYQPYVERQVAASIGNTLEEMGVESGPGMEPEPGMEFEPGMESEPGVEPEPAVAPAAAYDAETS